MASYTSNDWGLRRAASSTDTDDFTRRWRAQRETCAQQLGRVSARSAPAPACDADSETSSCPRTRRATPRREMHSAQAEESRFARDAAGGARGQRFGRRGRGEQRKRRDAVNGAGEGATLRMPSIRAQSRAPFATRRTMRAGRDWAYVEVVNSAARYRVADRGVRGSLDIAGRCGSGKAAGPDDEAGGYGGTSSLLKFGACASEDEGGRFVEAGAGSQRARGRRTVVCGGGDAEMATCRTRRGLPTWYIGACTASERRARHRGGGAPTYAYHGGQQRDAQLLPSPYCDLRE
ncbi:hypothetical protein C8R45DRAFT_947822 [Mycena sanguinolenta]|nr:hypothetical protein C8R45DRAFT_947822 [Mycena sanguinolenta]